MIIKGSYIVRRFKIESKSQPGTYHIVDVMSDGKLLCDCHAGFYRQPCKHKSKVEKYLDYEKRTKKGKNINR